MLVTTKNDCPHIKTTQFFPIDEFIYLPFQSFKCELCNERKELWICLTCAKSFCGRYINKHFMDHIKQNNK